MLKGLKPPKGFRDISGEDSLLRAFISESIEDDYRKFGYRKLEIPTLDYQSLFSSEFVGTHPWPGWHPRSLFPVVLKDFGSNYEDAPIKDHNMFLVPEGTASVCRYVAQGIEKRSISHKIPNKYYYITRCFRNELLNELGKTKKREFTQVGLEYIGDPSVYSDIEIFNLVIENLVNLGFKREHIRIRYSDVRLFNFLVERDKLDLSEQSKIKEILDNIASKRAKGFDTKILVREFKKILKEIKGISEGSREMWELLSSDYIPFDNLEKHLENFPVEIVKTMMDIYSESPKELQNNLLIDPAVIRGQDYYNKTTFQIDVKTPKGVISELGGGGRYDHFIERLLYFSTGKKYIVPSTGMAYSLERLTYSVEEYFTKEELNKMKNNKSGIVVWSLNPAKANKKAKKLRNKYDIVETVFSKDYNVALNYAHSKNFKLIKV